MIDSESSAISSLYDGYVELYHKLLDKNLSLTSKDFKASKLKFQIYFNKFSLQRGDTAKNPKFQKLFLKFFAFNCVFQTIPANFITKSPNKKIPWWYKLVFPIQNFLSYQRFHRTVKKWGYKSIFEAYCHIFQADGEETLKQINQFLDDSEKEYKSLLREHLQYVRPQTSSKSLLDDSNVSIYLNIEEKNRLYQGQWLSGKYRNADLNKIAQNLIKYFTEHDYLTDETVSKLEQHIEITNIPGFFYNNLTVPDINWENNSINKYSIYNFIPKHTPYLQKILVHEIGHVINLSNLPKNNDIFNYIPYESAINELGGEFFEILYYFPDFIAEIYDIDEGDSEKIASYNRLYDLIIKRYNAIQFKIYTNVFKNPKFFKIYTKSVQKNIKTLIRKHLFLQPSNVKIFSPNIIHHIDYLRGLLLIQEPFYQSCEKSKEKYLLYKSKLKVFFDHLYFQPFKQIQNYFALNTEISSES